MTELQMRQTLYDLGHALIEKSANHECDVKTTAKYAHQTAGLVLAECKGSPLTLADMRESRIGTEITNKGKD